MTIFVVDFDELDFRELFEVRRDRARDVIKCAVGLAGAGEINMRNTFGKSKFAIARETIEDQGEALIALHVTGTSEIFIERRAQ